MRATTNFADLHGQLKRLDGFGIDAHLKNVSFHVLVFQKSYYSELKNRLKS